MRIFMMKQKSFCLTKSPVKNYLTSDLSCQGSAQRADLHALDSNTSHIFHIGVREKGLFHHPPKLCLYLILIAIMFSTANFLSAAEALNLGNALEIAMSNSPDIRRTELALEQSSESLKAQKAALKSNFSLSFNPFSFTQGRTFNDLFSTWNTNETKESNSTFRISQPIEWTDGTLSFIDRLSWRDTYSEFNDRRTKTYENNIFVSYQQPLFTYNRTKLELREVELDMENTLYSYAIQKLSLEQQVTQFFFEVYQRKMDLDIALEELENQIFSHEIIKNKVDAGISAKEELYQAELNLSTSELGVQNQQEALDNTLDNFKLLLGISIYDDISIDANVTLEIVEIDMNTALSNGLKNRLELRQREISIENALQNLTQTAALNEFKGSMNLSYGIIGTDEQFGEVYDTPTKTHTIGLSFDIPLWDWGEKKSRIKASEAGIKSQRISLEDERNNIIIAIRRAHRNLQKLVKQIDIANQNVRNAQLTYEINLERYKNGDLTSMDLSLFQNQLSENKKGVVETLINYKLALLDLKILSLWDFEKSEPVLPENISDF